MQTRVASTKESSDIPGGRSGRGLLVTKGRKIGNEKNKKKKRRRERCGRAKNRNIFIFFHFGRVVVDVKRYASDSPDEAALFQHLLRSNHLSNPQIPVTPQSKRPPPSLILFSSSVQLPRSSLVPPRPLSPPSSLLVLLSNLINTAFSSPQPA